MPCSITASFEFQECGRLPPHVWDARVPSTMHESLGTHHPSHAHSQAQLKLRLPQLQHPLGEPSAPLPLQSRLLFAGKHQPHRSAIYTHNTYA